MNVGVHCVCGLLRRTVDMPTGCMRVLSQCVAEYILVYAGKGKYGESRTKVRCGWRTNSGVDASKKTPI